MKIASWNINSIRLRLPMVIDVLNTYNPDVICFQETKTQDQFFPSEALQDIGYKYIEFCGEKSYNGVAIISKIPMTLLPSKDIFLENFTRFLSVKFDNNIELYNFYIPAGGDIPDVKENKKFKHKLDFIESMIDFFDKKPDDDRVIIAGDFNVAPLEHDVWSSKALKNVVSHTDIERKLMMKLLEVGGFIDSFRAFVPNHEKLYSWWSYRANDWQKSNRGRRLDHIWCTKNLENQLHISEIHQETRGKERPSDHALIMSEFDIDK